MALGPLTPVGGLVPETVPNSVTQPGVMLDPSVMGGPYNPAHGNAQWDMGTGYPTPWAIQQGLDLSNQPATSEGSLMAGPPSNLPPGQDPEQYADAVITLSHAAPWPSVQLPGTGSISDPEAYAIRQEYLQSLHAVDAGDTDALFSRNLQGAPASKRPWELSPNYETSGIPTGNNVGDLTGNNHTGWERFAGWAVPDENLNAYGFDHAHVTRQNPGGMIPVPDDTMQGAQRPMVMNIPGRYQDYAVGAGSPFYGQIPGVGGDVGAAEIGVPSDYTPPPDAPTNPAMAAPSGPPVWGVTGLGF